MSGYEVSGLWRYPVKSMGGERLETVTLTAAGIDGDRRWAVRDLETGKVASAKRPTTASGPTSPAPRCRTSNSSSRWP